MPAVRRRLFNALTLLSLLLCVAVCVLWSRGRDYLYLEVPSPSGVLRLTCYRGEISYFRLVTMPNGRHGPGTLGQVARHAAPCWLLAGAFAVLPAARAALFIRFGRPRPPGVCHRCGYDLRATPDRCPECGTAVAKAGAA